MPVSNACSCRGCQGLEKRYAKDQALLSYYKRQLLVRGWAGTIDDVEAAYMTAHASWYRSAVERGRETAARMGWGSGFGGLEKASRPSGEEMAAAGGEAGQYGAQEQGDGNDEGGRNG